MPTYVEGIASGAAVARIMHLYNSDPHSRHPNVRNEQPFLLVTTCVCRLASVGEVRHRLLPIFHSILDEDLHDLVTWVRDVW